MTFRANIQQQSLPSVKVLDLLIYFKKFRNFSNRELAEKLHYQETYFSQVLNGHKDGGEKLLHALETFFLLDNLNQIQQIDRKILELQQEKTVLQAATIEKFYAERAVTATNLGPTSAELNEAKKVPPVATGSLPVNSSLGWRHD